MTIVGWLAEFDSVNINIWSGDHILNFENRVYNPGHFISLSHAVSEIGTPSRRMTVAFAVTDPSIRLALLEDEGPLMVRGRLIYSNTNGATWNLVGNQFIGRLSNPRMSSGTYTVELETYTGDINRNLPLKWSHESQVKKSGDLAFEMAAQLSSSLEVRWPP